MRRFLSPIAVRLLLFNVLLVFLPAAGLFSLRAVEQQLLDLQERSMVQQARLVAAALSADPELGPAAAVGVVKRLKGRSESRIRVVDRTATVIADSAVRGNAAPEIEDGYSANAQSKQSRDRVLYRAGAWVWRVFNAGRGLGEPRPSEATRSEDEPTSRDVVRRALDGRYGATLRRSAGQRSLTIYSAVPIRQGGDGSVTGAVMVSQSTSRILRALWRVRLNLVQVFALSLAVAVVLSLLVSATIARPLIRLRNEADDLLDHRGRLRRTFRGSRRTDEIGDLTRALERLTARLERHLVFVESFSADVSHEFKNPLAAIRSAAELLPQTEDPAEREQLAGVIDTEVARLGRLLHGVREVSKVDAAVDTEAAKPVDVRSILTGLAGERPPVEVVVPAHPVLVTAAEDRLVQALRNVVENASSFSPPGGRIRASLVQQNGVAVVSVDDEGPGIPPEHLERIFDRFFSFRPASPARGDHDGLGLAIARAIVDAYGGTITASNRSPRGARIEIRLPLA
ncbi:MAG: Signal transduction histidine kinase [Acidobacteria bacterium]|nr:Signal transduction histidine kinase [Acidobacteriota bacterium]